MYSACHTHATYLRKQFCKTNTEVLTHQWPFVYFQELLNMWKYWQGWKAPGVAWEHWKTWNLIIICACLFWSCLIFMSYETHVFRSRHREEFLCKQIIVINCSHNTTVNEQLPRAVQTHRHPARIPALSAMFFVETSQDQQHRLFASPEWSHTLSWIAGWANWKKAGEGTNPLIVLLLFQFIPFPCQNWNTAGLCSSQVYIDYSRWKGGKKSKISIVAIMEPTGASLSSRDEQEPGKVIEIIVTLIV